MIYQSISALLLLLPIAAFANQSSSSQTQNVVVLESHLDVTCDTFTNRCIPTQLLIAKVGDRKIELRLYEGRPEALLALGTYPAKEVLSPGTLPYRLKDSYILTYPDGKTEKFDVVGLLQ
jgi:hypothetical protein